MEVIGRMECNFRNMHVKNPSWPTSWLVLYGKWQQQQVVQGCCCMLLTELNGIYRASRTIPSASSLTLPLSCVPEWPQRRRRFVCAIRLDLIWPWHFKLIIIIEAHSCTKAVYYLHLVMQWIFIVDHHHYHHLLCSSFLSLSLCMMAPAHKPFIHVF